MTTPAIGEFEQLLLLAVLPRGSTRTPTASTSPASWRTRAGRSISRGALYTSLDRLEKRGCFGGKALAACTDARGGLPRRLYTVTPRASPPCASRKTLQAGSGAASSICCGTRRHEADDTGTPFGERQPPRAADWLLRRTLREACVARVCGATCLKNGARESDQPEPRLGTGDTRCSWRCATPDASAT